MLKIVRFEKLPSAQLLERIRRTRLLGYDEYPIYETAQLELASFDTADLAPAQRYVLAEDVARVHALRGYFMGQGIDIFDLDCGLLFWYRDEDAPDSSPEEGPVPLIPPVVEESHEPDGRTVLIVNDGMHRVFAARQAGCRISAIAVRGVPRRFPYYALALQHGWDEVETLAEIPDGYRKKTYRDPDNYKALFRNFNAILPGVQKQRKRGAIL